MSSLQNLENQEFEYPQTVFIRDIDNKVFQGIVIECLSTIEGIALIEGGFIDTLFNRSASEHIKGIVSEQDSKSQSVNIHIEVNVAYGVPIPQKAEEIQSLVSGRVSALTGLHVSSVHVIFRALIPTKKLTKQACNTALPSPNSAEKEFAERSVFTPGAQLPSLEEEAHQPNGDEIVCNGHYVQGGHGGHSGHS